MDYIDPEQFLEQPNEIQDVLKKYHSNYYNCNNTNFRTIPIMDETELRKFIENKLNDKIIALYTCDGYKIGKAFDYDNMYVTNEQDLLQAYWNVACKLAKNNNNNRPCYKTNCGYNYKMSCSLETPNKNFDNCYDFYTIE